MMEEKAALIIWNNIEQMRNESFRNLWLEKVTQYTRRVLGVVISPLMNEETMSGEQGSLKENKKHQNFSKSPESETIHRITRSENCTDPQDMKLDTLVKFFNRYCLPKINKFNNRYFLRKQTKNGAPEDHSETLFEVEKECEFLVSSERLLASNNRTSKTDQKLRGKLMKAKV